MLAELDTFIATRLLVSWFPLIVLWIAKGRFVSPKPEMLGSIALVLAGRLLAESFPGFPAILRLIFCGLPILGGAFVFAGVATGKLKLGCSTYWQRAEQH